MDEIDVDNAIDNRETIWDLRSKEGLEIAAGYYPYHVESKLTGDVKIGKFTVIK